MSKQRSWMGYNHRPEDQIPARAVQCSAESNVAVTADQPDSSASVLTGARGALATGGTLARTSPKPGEAKKLNLTG
jgi:hypothetical protein